MLRSPLHAPRLPQLHCAPPLTSQYSTSKQSRRFGLSCMLTLKSPRLAPLKNADRVEMMHLWTWKSRVSVRIMKSACSCDFSSLIARPVSRLAPGSRKTYCGSVGCTGCAAMLSSSCILELSMFGSWRKCVVAQHFNGSFEACARPSGRVNCSSPSSRMWKGQIR